MSPFNKIVKSLNEDALNIKSGGPLWLTILLSLCASVGLYFTSFYSYILFHSLAEIFSIVIEVGVFMVAWNSRRFLKNNYFLFIGVSFLFIAFIEVIHALSYKGMGVFPGFTANLPTQLWIAARYLQALSFLIATIFIKRKLRTDILFLGYLIITFLIFVSIFYWKIFPNSYIEGVGLTGFKKVSEYIIALIFLVSAILLIRGKNKFDKNVLRWMVSAVVIFIFSELAFTEYVSVYGFFNLLGHIFKIIAFFCIYKAVIEIGLNKPYNLLFLDLKNRHNEIEIEKNRLKKYMDVAGVIFVAINISQKVILINKKGAEVLKYKEKDIIGKNWFNNFLPKKEVKKVKSEFLKLINGESKPVEYFENNILTKDGKTRLIAWHNTILQDNGGSIISLSSGEDITEKRKAEEQLRDSETRFYSIAQSAIEAIITSGRKGEILFWNKGAEMIFGYTQKEVLGKPLTILMPPEYKKRHLKGIENFNPGKSHVIGKNIELKGVRKNGEEFPIEMSLASWKMDKKIFITGIIRDITERKELEERKNEFISIAGHELKTPLTTVKGFTQILQQYLSKKNDKKAQYFVSNINYHIDRINLIISDMLDVGKIERGKLIFRKEEFAPDNLVEDIIIGFQYLTNTHLIIRKGRVQKNVYADKHRVEQVLINLITNAIKYSKKGGEIIIDAGVKDNSVVISVKDSGAGIPKDKQKYIFDRFYRVHEKDNGVTGFGLGLYISKQIVERHGGRIWVESQLNKGSTFYFTIPLKKSADLNN